MGREDVPDIHPLLRTDDVFGAVYSPGDGIMDPATYCMALVKAAAKFGAQVILLNIFEVIEKQNLVKILSLFPNSQLNL